MTLVALEGLDGCGKSTVAPLIAERLGMKHIATPPRIMLLQHNDVLREAASLPRYLYYMASVAKIANIASSSDGSFLCERYLASAHALHIDVDLKFRDTLELLPIPLADLSLFLSVHEDERQSRLAQRGRDLDPFELKLSTDIPFREAVTKRMSQGPNVRHIETTGRSISAVVTDCADIISRWLEERGD